MSATQARLLLGQEHPCGYLPGQTARSLFVDPELRIDRARYQALLELGFRRSGKLAYRPACAACSACHPARVPVAEFRPGRSQRRCQQRNADLGVQVESTLDDEHFELYRRYLSVRHPHGGMDPEDREGFSTFLTPPWGAAEVLAFRTRAGTLLAGAVCDRLPGGLSAVYTYFEPTQDRRSLGTLAVLEQLQRARQLGLAYLYLGFWVPGAQTMDYKARFRPLELLTPDGWRRRH